jgi:2-polyprenyl-6-methoxyphenol hydroxylase-like FAD-dependent oxidoreductase
MRVLISGGGIAGLTLAYWLQRYGIVPTIVEKATHVRDSGYGIDFFGTGYDVASRMGLIDRLRSQQVIFDYVANVNRDGKIVTKLNRTLMNEIMYGQYLAILHGTLEEALNEALADAVDIRFSRTLTAIRQDVQAVHATFDDGTSESFDLLIGADGVHSLTRSLVFGAEERFARFLGYGVACYRLPDRYGIGHTWKMYSEPGRMVGAYSSSREGEIFTLFIYETANQERLPREQRLPRLRQIFAGMGWLTQQFLSDISDTEEIFMDAVTQIQMSSWHQGRVVLIGDACACPTLISGQGASLAMGEAYILAEYLHTAPGYQDAFYHYEQRLQAYIHQQQKSARGFAKSFVPHTLLERKVQQVIMNLFLREACIGLLRRQFGAQSILQRQPTWDMMHQ